VAVKDIIEQVHKKLYLKEREKIFQLVKDIIEQVHKSAKGNRIPKNRQRV
jgi:hypothetical protein